MSWFGIEKLSKVLRICLQITFVVGIFVTIFLSFILKWYFGWFFMASPAGELYYRTCIIILTPCGVCSLNVLWQLIGLLKTINNKNPFVRKNVIGFKRIAVSAFIISALFAILMFLQSSILTIAICYIFLVAGVCFIILAGLFQKAAEYKDENDMTI